MHDLVALVDLERARDPGAGGLHPGQQGAGVGLHAAPAHLLGVAGQPHLHVDLGAGHERAAAGDPLEQTLGDQGVEGLAHGHPGDAEVLDELALGGSRTARLRALRSAPGRTRGPGRACARSAAIDRRHHVAHRTSLRPPFTTIAFPGRPVARDRGRAGGRPSGSSGRARSRGRGRGPRRRRRRRRGTAPGRCRRPRPGRG